MAFRHSLRVRYHECDPQGVVYFARYPEYYDISLTELWRERLGGWQAMVEAGADMVVAEQSVRYLASARFDDLIDVELAVAHLGTTSLSWSYVISCDGAELVQGRVRHVCIDPQAKSKRPIPERVRAALDSLRTDAAAA